MSTTDLAALPSSSDSSVWSPEERALVEAAGLVHTDSRSGAKSLAERPVVAAFLQHCKRTGLDPIARQIYSIARMSKGQLRWQIQISIDGARLVAERSGEYEGQTTPQFTSDGVTWTDVWLSAEFPKAARVGVYRRGFREALFAVALWDAYVQTDYKGNVTSMWKKMGPLMLAKCAEMLALRKAFPQDLSGLYSAEEMSQADRPAPAPAPEPAAADAEPVAEPAAAEPVEDVVDAELVEDSPLDAAKAAAQDRLDAAKGAEAIAADILARFDGADVDALRALYVEAREGNALTVPVTGPDGSTMELGAAIQAVAAERKGQDS